jgi:hypothetical protein
MTLVGLVLAQAEQHKLLDKAGPDPNLLASVTNTLLGIH